MDYISRDGLGHKIERDLIKSSKNAEHNAASNQLPARQSNLLLSPRSLSQFTNPQSNNQVRQFSAHDEDNSISSNHTNNSRLLNSGFTRLSRGLSKISPLSGPYHPSLITPTLGEESVVDVIKMEDISHADSCNTTTSESLRKF